MKIFSNNVEDLVKIESIVLACYGQNGKSALIQPDREANSAFTLTNDGTTILNSIRIQNNHLYYLINRVLKDYKQDGAKNLFIYLVTASRLVLKPERVFFSLQDLRIMFKKLSLAKFMLKLTSEWNEVRNDGENLVKLSQTNEILTYFKKMCVINDLDTFNLNLSKTSKKLLCDFLDFRLNSGEISFGQCEKIIQESLDDFSSLVHYCESCDLDRSKILNNQFLIDRKFTYCSKSLANCATINSIFVLKAESLKAEIKISEDINSVFTKLKHNNEQVQFSNQFLNKLSHYKINLIFFEGFLSENKKSQLKSIGCSFIDYLTRENILFLTHRLGIDPVETQKDNLDTCVLSIDSFEILDENLTTFKIKKITNLSFILFCSHMKINFINFRIYFRKCLTSLAKLVSVKSEFSGTLIKSCFFELKCLDLVPKIVSTESKNGNYLTSFGNFVAQLFQYLLLKFKSFKNLKQLFEYEFNENVYEVMSLKLECFAKCLYFIQSLLNVDCVHFANSFSN